MIARQLRLRNLGGIIIVDQFIDAHGAGKSTDRRCWPGRPRHWRKNTKITINGLPASVWWKSPCKRTRESLASAVPPPGPVGGGEIKTAQTVASEVLRGILREARQYNAKEYRILAAQSVIDIFSMKVAQSGAMADFIGKPISLQVETVLQPGAVRRDAGVNAYGHALPAVCATA